MKEKTFCHDCKKEIKDGMEFMQYETKGQTYAKCKTCHKKDPILRNFQPTEVYSRVVGYIRPIDQWNKGKREEYRDRTEFKIADPACC